MSEYSARTFDLQPTLSDERVVIRPILPSDWTEMVRAASDPEIWAQHPVSDRYKEQVFKPYFIQALESQSAFAIIDKETGLLCGSSRYHGLDLEKSEIEIGWTFLNTRYWGGRYNRSIKRLMLSHAFRYVETVVFWVGKDNLRSRRAMEKIGAKLQAGVFTRPLSGELPYVIYTIKRNSWDQRRF